MKEKGDTTGLSHVNPQTKSQECQWCPLFHSEAQDVFSPAQNKANRGHCGFASRKPQTASQEHSSVPYLRSEAQKNPRFYE